MANLVDKFNRTIIRNNQVYKLGVKCIEIIGVTKFVEKWVDNLVIKFDLKKIEEKLAEKIWWNTLVKKLSWKSLQCTVFSVQ